MDKTKSKTKVVANKIHPLAKLELWQIFTEAFNKIQEAPIGVV